MFSRLCLGCYWCYHRSPLRLRSRCLVWVVRLRKRVLLLRWWRTHWHHRWCTGTLSNRIDCLQFDLLGTNLMGTIPPDTLKSMRSLKECATNSPNQDWNILNEADKNAQPWSTGNGLKAKAVPWENHSTGMLPIHDNFDNWPCKVLLYNFLTCLNCLSLEIELNRIIEEAWTWTLMERKTLYTMTSEAPELI